MFNEAIIYAHLSQWQAINIPFHPIQQSLINIPSHDCVSARTMICARIPKPIPRQLIGLCNKRLERAPNVRGGLSAISLFEHIIKSVPFVRFKFRNAFSSSHMREAPRARAPARQPQSPLITPRLRGAAVGHLYLGGINSPPPKIR